MKIIASTSAWKDDLDHALTRIAAMGFHEVDLIAIGNWGMVSLDALLEDFEAETARVSVLLEKHGLRAVSVNTAFKPDLNARDDADGNAERLNRADTIMRFMDRMGIRIGAHYPGHIADWKNDPEGVWSATVTSLREIQAVAKKHPNLRLTPEIHYQTPFETPDAARRLLREFPELPYTYEPSHFIVQGHEIRDTEDLLAGASHVHLRGCAKGRLQAPYLDAESAMRWVVEKLKARAYTGFISLEYLPGADFDVEADILGLRELISSIMRE